ncbi:MAG: hypothetical protein HXX15_11030 [Rhodopseudomonas sp.]|uniref:hypothetical protein n=1 Tax=Rhodopseudomonas sp. TaxID=1078 RepID=UPI0018266BFD|nr:hypothetical protein [Rhodopseudomonas sp.]NVN86608.1 hypothetical protein [Rhodopseudomonas sp.]
MSLLDKFLPRYQFSERHHIKVRCGPGELLDVIQEFRPPKDGFSELAMAVRQLPARLLHWLAPARVPRPSPFTLDSFTPLARDGDREIVAGLIGRFWRADFGLCVVDGAAGFLACNPAKTSKLAIGFSTEQIGAVTVLTTETRVYCPDRYSLTMFFPYWLAIRPVSGMLRRRALGTVRRLAESRAHDQAIS